MVLYVILGVCALIVIGLAVHLSRRGAQMNGSDDHHGDEQFVAVDIIRGKHTDGNTGL